VSDENGSNLGTDGKNPTAGDAHLETGFEKKRLAHAYLFEGERGTGKREAGLLLAQSEFCENLKDGYIPCGKCIQCRRIESGNHPDVYIVEVDGQSIKIDQIRDLQRAFSKKGMETNRKFYMIVHADQMTASAANSLLKFLEEPPAETTAVLTAENGQDLLPTIRSRCQPIPFYPLTEEERIHFLVESGINPANAALAAQFTNHADEAKALLHDPWFLQAVQIMLKLYEIFMKKGLMEALLFLQTDWQPHFQTKEQMDLALDLFLFIHQDLLHIQLGYKENLVFPNQAAALERDATVITGDRLIRRIRAILTAKKRLRSNVNGLLLMEQLLINLQEGSAFV
jgi:DNA polymerase III, delta' subunit